MLLGIFVNNAPYRGHLHLSKANVDRVDITDEKPSHLVVYYLSTIYIYIYIYIYIR